MKFLLDTDHISILQRRSGPEYAALAARIAQHSPTDLAFSIVSFHEQFVGVKGFSAALVLPFDAPAAAVFDGLQSQRVRVGTMDLRIAAIALSQGLILLTRNTRDFSKVPGLVTEDWTV